MQLTFVVGFNGSVTFNMHKRI